MHQSRVLPGRVHDHEQGRGALREGGWASAIDWLVCPYRTLDHRLLDEAARQLFGMAPDTAVLILAAVTLGAEDTRATVSEALVAGRRVFVYFRAQLGGEVSLSPTDRSPEFSFDITLVEIEPGGDHPSIGRYANPEWAGRGIQGPSIADTFKRTFYHMVFKFQLGLHDRCAGTVLALPTSVWDSWQRHLGGPALVKDSTDDLLYHLPKPEGVSLTESITATIIVFDVDVQHGSSPNPLRVEKVIRTDTPTLLHYTFDVVPEAALGGGASDRLYADICSRVLLWWPGLAQLTT